MKSDPFLKLIGGIAVAFAFPWIFLIVVPFVTYSNVEAIPYGEGDEVEGGIAGYPEKTLYRHGSSDYGRQVYASEGCAYCHTQVVRPTYAGPDMWRPGWGGDEENGTPRETRPRDYVLEEVAPLGYQRIGQDLSNVGHRITSRELMHRHLWDPKSIDLDSGMPAFKHLYKDNPFGEGMVPTPKAEALVDYMLSLKKDQPVPAGS
jgi:cytochrome c oxidase cbb3-type subunit 2